MHAAGWVHRDVSTGNILMDNKVTRLADMEYAKIAGQGDEHRLVRESSLVLASQHK